MMTPTTFVEGQTAFYGRLLAAAGIAIGLGICALTGVLAFGGWPETLFAQIITILGFALGGAMVILLYVIHALAIGGPIGKSELALSKGTLSLKTEGDK